MTQRIGRVPGRAHPGPHDRHERRLPAGSGLKAVVLLDPAALHHPPGPASVARPELPAGILQD
jgi:hypothetical protein